MTKIGFIGFGNMAKAIASGIMNAKIAEPESIFVSTSREDTALNACIEYGVNSCTDNAKVVRDCDIVFLAVKPQVLPEVIPQIADVARDDQIFVSMAAGKTTEWIEEGFGKPIKLVRIMPNTPALVGAGMTAYCHNGKLRGSELKQVTDMLESFGKAIKLDESLINAETAVGGCAPAFAYMFIDALAQGGVAEGLDPDQSLEIAAQTVLGAARMVMESGKEPAWLVKDVCSPGGSTIKGVESLREDGFEEITAKAVRTSAEASRRL